MVRYYYVVYDSEAEEVTLVAKERTPGEILARALRLEQEGVDEEVVEEALGDVGSATVNFFQSQGVRCSCVITENGREVYRSDDSKNK